MDQKTIPGLARILNVSDATVRRYITNFPQFFKRQKIEGWDHFDVDPSIKVLQRINDVSAAGQKRSVVLKILLNEFKVVHDQSIDSATTGTSGISVIEFGPETLAALESATNALNMLSENLKKNV